MHAFRYHRARSLAEAERLYADAADARFLAGGMTLLPAMKLRLAAPSDLIDLAALGELRGVRVDRDRLIVGAMTLHAEVAESSEVRSRIPALAILAEGIGDAQVRNRGTIGGSIANSDPAADYPAAVLGLGATIVTTRREIAADDFFLGLFETALEPGELVTAVSFPIPERAGYVKFPNPASRYAIVGVMASRVAGAARVAVTGAGACAFRVAPMEQALAAAFSPDVLAGIEVAADDLNDDLHADAEYRAHLVGVIARRAVQAAYAPRPSR
jgi:carbon-monoxide dehydrogenase medium subunit